MFFAKLLEFLRRFSRRLHLLFKRQNIYLIEDKRFEQLVEEAIKEGRKITCHICGTELTIEDVMGWSFDEDNNLLFFCDNPSCIEKMG